jgi:hypothetical protein
MHVCILTGRMQTDRLCGVAELVVRSHARRLWAARIEPTIFACMRNLESIIDRTLRVQGVKVPIGSYVVKAVCGIHRA